MTGTAVRQRIAEAEGNPAILERLVMESHREAAENESVLQRVQVQLKKAEADRERLASKVAAAESERDKQAEKYTVEHRRYLAALDQTEAKATEFATTSVMETSLLTSGVWADYVVHKLFTLLGATVIEMQRAFPGQPVVVRDAIKAAFARGVGVPITKATCDYMDAVMTHPPSPDMTELPEKEKRKLIADAVLEDQLLRLEADLAAGV